MFEDLFVDPRTTANLWSAPLLEERLSYLRHCAQSGARPSTLAQDRGCSDQSGSSSGLA